MEMELGFEEFGASSDNDATQIVIKGKRTKRQRQLSPCGVATMTYSSSSASEDHGGGGARACGSFSSTTTAYESTEEEEDMANCLILLAQGGGEAHKQAEDQGGRTEKGSSRKFAEMATASAAGKVGFYVYECKTCNRTFPSFQALGGHRASHKKPKTAVEEKKPPALRLPPPSSSPQCINYDIEEAAQNQIKSTQISLQFGSNGGSSNKTKIHECSICGSEFTSGQALGGHMRRHRASTNGGTPGVGMGGAAIETSCNTAATSTVEVKPRNILQLDLNLPAPEDDLRESKFQFAGTQKSLVMSAPALVDCHY